MELLMNYFLRVTPGAVLVLAFLWLLPKKFTELRIIAYILIFILFRDAMTPLKLWEFSPNFGIRFINDPLIVASLGISSGFFVAFIQRFEPELANLVVWFRGSKIQAIFIGILTGVAVATPVIIYQHYLPDDLKPSPVPSSMWISLWLVCFIGNLLEEMLFRGYFQGYLEKQISPPRAALVSGVFFGACHVFLAISVTHLGITLLAFAVFEGIIAGFVRMKSGVLASTLTHGLAIFLLSSGIV